MKGLGCCDCASPVSKVWTSPAGSPSELAEDELLLVARPIAALGCCICASRPSKVWTKPVDSWLELPEEDLLRVVGPAASLGCCACSSRASASPGASSVELPEGDLLRVVGAAASLGCCTCSARASASPLELPEEDLLREVGAAASLCCCTCASPASKVWTFLVGPSLELPEEDLLRVVVCSVAGLGCCAWRIWLPPRGSSLELPEEDLRRMLCPVATTAAGRRRVTPAPPPPPELEPEDADDALTFATLPLTTAGLPAPRSALLELDDELADDDALAALTSGCARKVPVGFEVLHLVLLPPAPAKEPRSTSGPSGPTTAAASGPRSAASSLTATVSGSAACAGASSEAAAPGWALVGGWPEAADPGRWKRLFNSATLRLGSTVLGCGCNGWRTADANASHATPAATAAMPSSATSPTRLLSATPTVKLAPSWCCSLGTSRRGCPNMSRAARLREALASKDPIRRPAQRRSRRVLFALPRENFMFLSSLLRELVVSSNSDGELDDEALWPRWPPLLRFSWCRLRPWSAAAAMPLLRVLPSDAGRLRSGLLAMPATKVPKSLMDSRMTFVNSANNSSGKPAFEALSKRRETSAT